MILYSFSLAYASFGIEKGVIHCGHYIQGVEYKEIYELFSGEQVPFSHGMYKLTSYAQFDKKAEFHKIVLAFAPPHLLLSNAESILLLFKGPKKTSLRREHSCPGLDPELCT